MDPSPPLFRPRPRRHPHGLASQIRHAVKQRDQLQRRGPSDEPPPLTSSHFHIPSLPGLASNSTLVLFAGEIPSTPSDAENASDAHIFFFLVRARHIADREKFVLWFNGGPGCSSFDGSLMEVGPVRLVPGGGGELRELEGAWNEYANVLFVDQPPGTGYSYTSGNDYVHELDEASTHLINFLQRFYEIFPEYSNMDTYLAGESYAGQYIPYFARSLLSTPTSLLPTSNTLRGIMIGNGWIDPVSQYPAYLDFAYDSGVVPRDGPVAKKLEGIWRNCNETMNARGGGRGDVRVHENVCEGILSAITESTIQTVNGHRLCINSYDIRLTDDYPQCGMGWPPDLSDVYPYLQREDVKQAFHAGDKDGEWVECSGVVGGNFWVRESKPSVTLLPELLGKINVLLFAGDQDLICNHVGIERMIDSLEWNGQTGWGDATPSEWYVSSTYAGSWTTSRNLTYAKIANASHMVPFDVPLVSLDMALRFMNVDLLAAAGTSAQVPSRVGDEPASVVAPVDPASGAVTAADGTLVGSSGTGEMTVGDGSGGGSGSEVAWESYYNVGSAAFVILILGAAAAFVWFLRSRRKPGQTIGDSLAQFARADPAARRRSGGAHGRKGSLRALSLGKRRAGAGEGQGQGEEEVELEGRGLLSHMESREWDEETGEPYRNGSGNGSRNDLGAAETTAKANGGHDGGGKGKEREREDLRGDEELFSLGDEGDSDEEHKVKRTV